MKKLFFFTLLAGSVFGQTLLAQQQAQPQSVQASAPQAANPQAVTPAAFSGTGSMPGLGILRGLFSVIQSPAELVRGETLRFSSVTYSDYALFVHYPFAFVAGISQGCGHMSVRIICGAGDILTLGFLSPYSPDYPPFIWESQWTR